MLLNRLGGTRLVAKASTLGKSLGGPPKQLDPLVKRLRFLLEPAQQHRLAVAARAA